jgi:hypothetical protein
MQRFLNNLRQLFVCKRPRVVAQHKEKERKTKRRRVTASEPSRRVIFFPPSRRRAALPTRREILCIQFVRRRSRTTTYLGCRRERVRHARFSLSLSFADDFARKKKENREERRCFSGEKKAKKDSEARRKRPRNIFFRHCFFFLSHSLFLSLFLLKHTPSRKTSQAKVRRGLFCSCCRWSRRSGME